MIVAIIALIAWRVFMLLGLANGLSNDNGATLRRMDADAVMLQKDVRFYLHRSILPMATGDEIRQFPGVDDVTPVGHLTATVLAANGSERIDVTILGVDPEGFVVADPVDGVPLAEAPEGGVLVARSRTRASPSATRSRSPLPVTSLPSSDSSRARSTTTCRWCL